MRMGIDGLSLLVQQALGKSPCDGSADAFRNRRTNQLKLLVWDSTLFRAAEVERAAELYQQRLQQCTDAEQAQVGQPDDLLLVSADPDYRPLTVLAYREIERIIRAGTIKTETALDAACRTPMLTIPANATTATDQATFVEYEKILMQGIESGKGVFQFAGQSAHHAPERSSEKPMIGQLLAMKQTAEAAGSNLIISGRYQVDTISVLATTINDIAVANDHHYYRLEVTDIQNHKKYSASLI